MTGVICFQRLWVIGKIRIIVCDCVGNILGFAMRRLKFQQFNGSPLYGIANIEPQRKSPPFLFGRHTHHLPAVSSR